jgi:hypothetical protein
MRRVFATSDGGREHNCGEPLKAGMTRHANKILERKEVRAGNYLGLGLNCVVHHLELGLNCGLRTDCELVTGGLTGHS